MSGILEDKNAKSSSLWSYYSQLKNMLSVEENIDISRQKKSKVFTLKEMKRFLDNASGDEYLLKKYFLLWEFLKEVEFLNWWPCQPLKSRRIHSTSRLWGRFNNCKEPRCLAFE
ncbi:hypothetical protein Zmor_006612 [Zophobas morio]|uniref:Uncharacterized protein n=1 Tax=Zophobas morio TaxID=2755281 RepID=A0AA38MMV1_9CUCU|nr:hypothetical protein Zmor_006612 [Zophobas morio]